MDFYEEQSEIICQLETDIIYQFTCILERERNRNKELNLKVQEETTVTVTATEVQIETAQAHVEDYKENIVPSNTVQEIEKPNLFNKFSQINIQNLLSKPIPAEIRSERIVPKLGRSSTLNRGSFLDLNTLKNSMSSNCSQIEKDPFLTESRNSGRSLATQESTISICENTLEPKNVSNSNEQDVIHIAILNKANDLSFNTERGSIHSNQDEPKPKRQPSAVLQSIAELRKGIAMKKKANETKMLLNSPNMDHLSKSTINANLVSKTDTIAIPNTMTSNFATSSEISIKGTSNKTSPAVDGEEIDANVNVQNQILPSNSDDSLKIESDIKKFNEIPIEEPHLKSSLIVSETNTEKNLDDSIIEDISEPEEFIDSILLDEQETTMGIIDSQDKITSEPEPVTTKIPEKSLDDEQIPSNLYTGTVNSFLLSSNAQGSEPSGPITSFLPLLQKEPEPKAKPPRPIKALQIAALAAKKEQAEKEKRQKLKEDRLKQQASKTENLKRLNENEIGGFKKKQSTTKVAKPVELKIQTPKAQMPVLKPKLPIPTKLQKIKNPILFKEKPADKPLSPKKNDMVSLVDSSGEIFGIDDSDTDSDSEKKRPEIPSWAQSPFLKETLQVQQKIDPDSIFQNLPRPNMKEIMGIPKGFTGRPSIMAVESMEELTHKELLDYKTKMGY